MTESTRGYSGARATPTPSAGGKPFFRTAEETADCCLCGQVYGAGDRIVWRDSRGACAVHATEVIEWVVPA